MQLGEAVNTAQLEILKSKLIMKIPEQVARFWITEIHSSVPVNGRGDTVKETTLKNWEAGFGAVVGHSSKGNPIFLIRSLNSEYTLFEYRETA